MTAPIPHGTCVRFGALCVSAEDGANGDASRRSAPALARDRQIGRIPVTEGPVLPLILDQCQSKILGSKVNGGDQAAAEVGIEGLLGLGRAPRGERHSDHHELIAALDVQVSAVEHESSAGVSSDHLEPITLRNVQGRDQRRLNGISDRRSLRLRPHIKHIDPYRRHTPILASTAAADGSFCGLAGIDDCDNLPVFADLVLGRGASWVQEGLTDGAFVSLEQVSRRFDHTSGRVAGAGARGRR
jgi:hypothetical protein